MRWAKLIVGLVLTVSIVSCNNGSTKSVDEIQSDKTETLMSEALRQIGMPNITNFQQLKLMKMIYELCDKENLLCYAYLWNAYAGKLVFLGKCVGYGVPFSAQYTNPEKIVDDPFGNYASGGRVVPQPDPNGLYMPSSSSATWIIMKDPNTGEIRPVYCEPQILISPFPMPDYLVQNKEQNPKMK